MKKLKVMLIATEKSGIVATPFKLVEVKTKKEIEPTIDEIDEIDEIGDFIHGEIDRDIEFLKNEIQNHPHSKAVVVLPLIHIPFDTFNTYSF